MIIISTIFGIICGVLLIRFSREAASFMKSTIGDTVFRDASNPTVYKILGILGIASSILGLLLSLMT